MSEEERLYEKDFWRGLVVSGDWKYFRNMMNEHITHLEKQMVVYVSSRDFEKAFGYSERADECRKILQLVSDRIQEVGGK